jgi:predicted nucleic acid-binding protein
MILVDSGPLVAILNRNEAHHGRCSAALAGLTGPMMSTWPVLTETMSFLGDRAGWIAIDRLWTMILRGELQVVPIEKGWFPRLRALMEKYRDVPMDLADASLVVLAERLKQRRIFTVDGDFRIYRVGKGHPFEIVP